MLSHAGVVSTILHPHILQPQLGGGHDPVLSLIEGRMVDERERGERERGANGGESERTSQENDSQWSYSMRVPVTEAINSQTRCIYLNKWNKFHINSIH